MKIKAADKTIEIFGFESAAGHTPTVLLITGGESAAGVWEKYSALSERPCRLAAVAADDWGSELSPWPAPKVFKGGAISSSGSLWFPGFAEYAAAHEPGRRPDKIYLSLGDKEKNTKNPVMSRVEEKTKEIYGIFRAFGTDCVFCFEPRGHFADPEGRLARGMARIAGNNENEEI